MQSILINQLLAPGKGIIAADDRPQTINTRLEEWNIEPTSQNRTLYREIVATTPGLEKFASGVIFHKETLGSTLSDGRSFKDALHARGIVIGIKVDEGLSHYDQESNEQYTKGLSSLAKRLKEHKLQGAQFCKWRSVFVISAITPSEEVIANNVSRLVTYTQIALESNYVPILEPEVLMDGSHSIDDCQKATKIVLHTVFEELKKASVNLSDIILKCNMILPGTKTKSKSTPLEVAQKTTELLKTVVPAQTGAVVFLSGGQSTFEAMLNLNAIGQNLSLPYPVSFSFDRAFMYPVLKIWQGKSQNIKKAQEELLTIIANMSKARTGHLLLK